MRNAPLLLTAVLVVALMPAIGQADRGALTLDGGGLVSGVRSAPPVGAGDAVMGSVGGAVVGIRYALRSSLEVYAEGEWFKSATFYNQRTVVTSIGSPVNGTLQSRVGRIGAVGGVDYIVGMVVRLHLGAQVGWANVTYGNVHHSAGLSYGTRSVEYLVLATRFGLEWAATDHLSFTVAPTAEFLVGSPGLRGVTIPIMASYSWYGVF